jgi:hypothetical protein
VSERLDAKLNLVVKNMDVKLEAAITNVTLEMRKENEQTRKESSNKIETKVQEIPYFTDYKTLWTIRRTLIFKRFFKKNNIFTIFIIRLQSQTKKNS